MEQIEFKLSDFEKEGIEMRLLPFIDVLHSKASGFKNGTDGYKKCYKDEDTFVTKHIKSKGIKDEEEMVTSIIVNYDKEGLKMIQEAAKEVENSG